MEPFFWSALVIAVIVTVLFIVAVYKKDNSIIDIFYGLIFVTVALFTFFFLSTGHVIAALVSVLTVVWGVRLSGRMYLKNRGKAEDQRYAPWRESWMQKGKAYFYLRSYGQVLLLKGLIFFLVSLPIVLVNTAFAMEWNAFVSLGLALWCVGFLFESIADFQLDTFLKNPDNHGRIMTSGLFRYSRRPNYFGESLMWWGIAVIAFSEPLHWIAFVSPAIITYIMYAVTGPLTEEMWEGNDEYRAYRRVTNYFIPWFPKKNNSL